MVRKIFYKSILLFIFLTSFFSCQRISVPEPSLNVLFGEWKFQSASGGFTGDGPGWSQSRGIRINFKKSGTVIRSEAGRVVQTENFKFVQKTSIFSDDISYQLDYPQSIDQSFSIKGDTLLLQDEVHDGFSYTYTRK